MNRFAAVSDDGRRFAHPERSAVDRWSADRILEGCNVDVYMRRNGSGHNRPAILVGKWRQEGVQ